MHVCLILGEIFYVIYTSLYVFCFQKGGSFEGRRDKFFLAIITIVNSFVQSGSPPSFAVAERQIISFQADINLWLIEGKLDVREQIVLGPAERNT